MRHPTFCFCTSLLQATLRPMDPSLLELICCPETHQPLRFATTDELQHMTSSSSATTLESALLREDSRVAYPIREGIPLLLIEEQIALA
ncbi:MAG: Trm112 family protein [Chthoniobacterales bacterium]